MSAQPRPHLREFREVAIVYRYLHHYRREFYELLRADLAARGVRLRLVVGQAGPIHAVRRDEAHAPWATQVRNRYLVVAGRELCWQPVLGAVRSADLVIVEQASRLPATYLLLALRRVGGPAVAFWGHGANIQGHRASPTGEAVKRWMSRGADWWFAYNECSVAVVAGLGYPRERITCVQNAVDTRTLREMRAQLTAADLATVRRELNVGDGSAAVFCGGLYADKRLGFLVAAADLVRRSLRDFELIVLGAGPDEGLIRAAAATRPWVHVVGPLYGEQKVRVMALAKVQALPGLVGLGILDGFALELPLVAAAVPFHSHEIAYLEPGRNGIMVHDWRDPAAYAAALVRALSDERQLARLRSGCREAAERYTVEAMVQRFAGGVEAALAAGRYRGPVRSSRR